MLTQIVNAQARNHEEVSVPFSKMKYDIGEILKRRGFVNEVSKKKEKSHKVELDFIEVQLKYENGVGTITGFKMISKPSRRMYGGKRDLKPVRQGYGISVVSTSKGLMTGDEARKAGVGGEILFEVW